MGLFSNRSQKTSKCGKNISDTLACGSCATSLFFFLNTFCDLLLNRRTATWNLFVKYNYPPKGRWIVVDIYLALSDPEGDRCFSIYQISWLKIKKELFVNKRHHFVRVCLRFNWQCFGDHFLWFCCKFSEKIFFYRPVNTDKPIFVSFLVVVGAAASFTSKISFNFNCGGVIVSTL